MTDDGDHKSWAFSMESKCPDATVHVQKIWICAFCTSLRHFFTWHGPSDELISWQASFRLDKMATVTYETAMASWEYLCPDPEVIKLFLCATQLSMKLVLLINLNWILTIAFFLLLNIAGHEISLLISMKMSTTSRENFMLTWVEHEKKFYNFGARNVILIRAFVVD